MTFLFIALAFVLAFFAIMLICTGVSLVAHPLLEKAFRKKFEPKITITITVIIAVLIVSYILIAKSGENTAPANQVAEESDYIPDSNPNEKGVKIPTFEGDKLTYTALYKKKVKGGVKVLYKAFDDSSGITYATVKFDCKGNYLDIGDGDTKAAAEIPYKIPSKWVKFIDDDVNFDKGLSKYACKGYTASKKVKIASKEDENKKECVAIAESTPDDVPEYCKGY
jgi:hypothetical protein